MRPIASQPRARTCRFSAFCLCQYAVMPTAIQPEEDDDWSDFTAAGAVDSTSDRNPTESPSRNDNATVRWAKTGGAIPLSIFGEDETDDVEVEEGSGREDPRVADGKDKVRRDVKPVDVKDLIANLYGREGNSSSPRVSKTENSEFDANGEVSDREWEIVGGTSGGGGGELVDEDDEWEFRAAPEEMTTEIEKFDSKGVVQGGLDLTSSRTFTSSDALSFEANGHPKFNLFIPSANGHGIDSPTKEEDGDGDEGWDFQDARLESHYNVNKNNGVVDPIKVEDREVVISNKTLNGVISDISGHGPVSDSSINGLSLDVAGKNAYDGSGWEFHASGTESLFRAENPEANMNTWETSETVIPLFDTEKEPLGDLFVASSETTEGFSGADLSLDFHSDPSSSKDTNHERNINSVMKNTASDDDFWEFNRAVPGNGPFYHDKSEDFSNDSAAGKIHRRINSGENLWESGNAIIETRSKHEKNKPALPLSLFGDEELENNYHLPIQHDFIIKGGDFTVKGDHERRDRATHATSLTDLIASLYSQPVPNPPMAEVHEVTQGGLNSATTGSEQVAVTEGDDFDDWDFHGASVDIRGGSPGVDEHIQQFSNSELSSTLVSPETTRPKENPKSSSNDMIWEYSDVLLPANSAEQSYITTVAPQNPSSKLKLGDLIGFYNSLEGELRVAANHHLNNGKIHEDASLNLHNEEFQELYNELHAGELVSELPSVSPSQSGINIDALLEALQGPKFQVLEAEYSLSSRLITVKNDINSLGELLKHATLVHRLLRFGTEEDHNGYVSTWFKVISACSKELKHGAIIWRNALEHHLQAQILSKTEGKLFILSLGEIYRVVEVLGVSVRFYKPWLMSSADFPGITALLHECASAWSSSGLENALRSIWDPLEFQYEGSVEAIVESIKQIRDLDICALGEMIFAAEDPSCRLSLLIPGAMPGMKMVSWNGEPYFLKLVNLWAHLVSSEPPELPQIYLSPS